MRRLAAGLFTLLTLAGCPIFLGPSSFCASPVTPASKAFGIEHQPLTVPTPFPPAAACKGLAASRVDVRIITPGNLTYTGAVEVSDAITALPLVRFTPDSPGRWELIVTFEPSLGRVQVPVDVAEDRSRHQKFEAVRLSCLNQPWRTKQGTVLCEIGGSIRVSRDGAFDAGVRESFEGNQLAVLGDVIWSTDGTKLTRRTDTGSALRIDAEYAMQTTPRWWLGYTNQALAIRAHADAGLTAYFFTDGGIVAQALARTKASSSAFANEAGLWELTSVDSRFDRAVCSPADAGCRSVIGSVLGYDETAGLWVAGPRAQELFLEVDSATAVRTRSFAYPPDFERAVPNPLAQAWFMAKGRVAFESGEGDSVVVDATPDDFKLGWYGPGGLLGTRGDYIVLSVPADPQRVVFVEP